MCDTRAFYARKTYGLNIVKRPIEDDYWKQFYGTYDIVTLWDVIEHVNFPYATLNAASKLLKPGGLMFIDTPCRDSFYHRFGELTYAISGGRFPTLLNIMYSAHPFGHKQIFSTSEARQLMNEVGMQTLELRKFHELSFPISYYLKKLFRSDDFATYSAPVVEVILKLMRIQNKMLVIARRN